MDIDDDLDNETKIIDKIKQYGFNDENKHFFDDLEAEMYEISSINPDITN